MKKIPAVITLVSLYAVFFQAAPYMDVPGDIIIAMFLVSPFLVLYMAYVILKYGKPSGNKYDDRFYNDWDYRRNGKEEIDV